MTDPTWAPIDDATADLLELIADPDHPVGRDAAATFLAACKADADAHGGLVSVNRVSAALASRDILPHRYSSFWAHFTGKGKPMRPATPEDAPIPWEIRKGSTSGNDGKPMRLRVWLGGAA